MDKFIHTIGPRILEDGTNLDQDIISVFPDVQCREITDPVSDGSLGPPGYQPGQLNKDGTDL